MFDSDKSGSISLKELGKLFKKMDMKMSPKDIQNLMNLMDNDGSGQVDFNEFSRVMADQFFKQPTEEEIEMAFEYFDKG